MSLEEENEREKIDLNSYVVLNERNKPSLSIELTRKKNEREQAIVELGILNSCLIEEAGHMLEERKREECVSIRRNNFEIIFFSISTLAS